MWRWLLYWVLRFSQRVPVEIRWRETFSAKWVGTPHLDLTSSRTRALRISSALSSNDLFPTVGFLCASLVFGSGPYRRGDFLVFLPQAKVFGLGSCPLSHIYHSLLLEKLISRRGFLRYMMHGCPTQTNPIHRFFLGWRIELFLKKKKNH